MVLTPEIIQLIAYMVGPIAIALLVYFKGRADGKDVVNKLINEANDAQQRKVDSIQSKNIEVERNVNEVRDTIRSSSDDADKLLELWSKIGYGPKDTDPKSPGSK